MVKQINKEWYRSKTVWSALASLVVAVVTALYGETSPFVAGIIVVLSGLGLYGRSVAAGTLKW